MAAKGIAVKQKDSAGGPHIAGGQTCFEVDDKLVVVFGDSVTPHAPPFLPHTAPVMNVPGQHSSFFEIEGKKVIVKDNAANCGHTSTGRDWFVLEE